jgi:hypothetical protein
MKGIFGRKDPKDLLYKLEREYGQLLSDPTNGDMAWNFFVTAEHIPDWLARSDPKSLGGKSINTFKRNNPLMHVCENLANGAKHFIPRVKPEERLNVSVDDTGTEMTSYIEDDYIEDDYYAEEPMLMVYLTPYEVAEFQKAGFQYVGAKIEVPWLATQVLQFWRNYIKP